MPSKVHGLILKISGALPFNWESHSVQIRFLEKKKSKTKRSFVRVRNCEEACQTSLAGYRVWNVAGSQLSLGL